MNFRNIFVLAIGTIVISGSVFADTPSVLWTARHNGTANNADYAKDIAVDSANDVYVTGYAKNTGTDYDFVTIKYTPDGNTAWTKSYNRSSSNPDFAVAMTIDSASNVIVAGYGYTSATGYDGLVVKYDSAGTQLWAKAYNLSLTNDDRFYDVAADTSGNIYAVGRAGEDCLIVKYTSDGIAVWTKTYNGSANGFDSLYKLAVDGSGNVYACGESAGTGTGQDCLTVKYSTNGTLLWAKTYNGSANGWDLLQAIVLDAAGNAYVTGSVKTDTDSDYVIIKYTSDGVRPWLVYSGFDGRDEYLDITLTSNGDVAAAGYSEYLGKQYMDVSECNSQTGEFLWGYMITDTGASMTRVLGIAPDNLGNVYITGRIISSVGATNYATAGFDSDGDLLWCENYDGPASQTDVAAAIAVRGKNVYVTGYSTGVGSNYDYATIKYSYLPDPCPVPPQSDLTGDCKVDFDDLAVLTGDWIESQDFTNGPIIGWGDDFHGQAAPPDGNDYVAIDAGQLFSIALKSDGSIVGWGYNDDGQASPPAGNNYVSIAAGAGHGLALKSDGSLAGWGWNYYGQATPPTGNNFIAIAAGGDHSLALKSDGSIVSWGRSNEGQTTPQDGNDFIAVAAGGFNCLALKSDGSVICWGHNNSGESTAPVGNDFTAIAAGNNFSMALKSDGSIICWGSNNVGQSTPPVGNDFVAIAAGSYYGLAIKYDGSIVGWGGDAYLSAPLTGNNYVAVAAGWNHSLALQHICTLELPGDLNNNCKVDFLDLAVFADSWFQCGLADPNDCYAGDDGSGDSGSGVIISIIGGEDEIPIIPLP